MWIMLLWTVFMISWPYLCIYLKISQLVTSKYGSCLFSCLKREFFFYSRQGMQFLIFKIISIAVFWHIWVKHFIQVKPFFISFKLSRQILITHVMYWHQIFALYLAASGSALSTLCISRIYSIGTTLFDTWKQKFIWILIAITKFCPSFGWNSLVYSEEI